MLCCDSLGENSQHSFMRCSITPQGHDAPIFGSVRKVSSMVEGKLAFWVVLWDIMTHFLYENLCPVESVVTKMNPKFLWKNQTFCSLFPSQWGAWYLKGSHVSTAIFNCISNTKKKEWNSTECVNEWKMRYRPSPLSSSERLCEFSGSVITMEYIPWSFSTGSITWKSIDQLFSSTFMS